MKKNTKTAKALTEEVIADVTKRTRQIYEADMHWRTRDSELSICIENGVRKMREGIEKLNTRKNSFNAVRKAIAALGLYHHALRNRIAEVDAKLHSLVTLKDMKRECGDDVAGFAAKLKHKADELKANGKQKYTDGNPKRAQELIAIAESIGKIKVYPEPWYHFKLSKGELELVNGTTTENLESKLSNITTIGVKKYIDLAMELLRDDYYIRRAIGLAMLSGRRMSEIYVSANFEAVGEDKLKFSGALKKGADMKNGTSQDEYIIDSIIDAHEFVHYFDLFRKDENVISIIEECEADGNYLPVNKRVSSISGYSVKTRFKRLNADKTDWKFSDSRAMAVAVAYFLDSKKPSGERIEDETIYYKKFLCHENVAEMLHYREFSVISDVNQKTLLERLYEAEEDVLTLSARSEITTDRFLKVHDALCEFLSKNPGTNKITVGLIKRPKKKGGPGAAHDVAVEYFEMIRKHIC